MNIVEKIKELQLKKDGKVSLNRLEQTLGIGKSTISSWDKKNPSVDKLKKVADYFGTSIDALLEDDSDNHFPPSEDIAYFEIIGTVSAGYDGLAVEEYTGETIPIPRAMLHNKSEKEFFALRIKGDSMYPRFLDGDTVLVLRCTSVDSGSIAVILYEDEEATVKKVVYEPGEDWLEMIPANPEYKTKRIEGEELTRCRVLGQVVKLIRDV